MKSTLAGNRINALGSYPVVMSVALGLGLTGLVFPFEVNMDLPERAQAVLSVMREASSNFDMVPPGILERIEEEFYQKIPQMSGHKFDVAFPLRAGSNFKRCFVWNSTLHLWEKAEASLTRIKFTGSHFMLIVKEKEKATVAA